MTTANPNTPETFGVLAKRRRIDSSLEAEAAEFLVLGHLLLNGIEATKSYTNTKDHDLVAANPRLHKSTSIQVKSRWRSDANHFLVKEISADFLVLVRLNRGPDAKGKGGPPRAPEFLALTKMEANEHHKRYGRMGKISSEAFPKERWNDWSIIRAGLGLTAPLPPTLDELED